MKENELYSVGDVCRKTGITRKTLFYYDKIGLLKPAKRKGAQKHKFYDEDQIGRLYEIMKYRQAGLNISEIKNLMSDLNSDRFKILVQASNRLNAELTEKAEQIELLKQIIAKETKL
ncbi:MAG: MerR family transcriptional regulator [Faecalicoccus sp.]|nr:MerR family transcriptional regulator [Faecalicoccus sp.]